MLGVIFIVAGLIINLSRFLGAFIGCVSGRKCSQSFPCSLWTPYLCAPAARFVRFSNCLLFIGTAPCALMVLCLWHSSVALILYPTEAEFGHTSKLIWNLVI